MKRTLLTLTILLLTILSTLAYDCQVDGIYYNLDKTNKTASVTYKKKKKASYKESSITIPQEITYKNTKYKVTSIGEYAFYHCSSLSEITIPNSVTSIGKEAFSLCRELSAITLPHSLILIDDFAFCYCESLSTITLPHSLTSIGDGAFCYCESLSTITLPNSVTSIGSNAFCYCESLSTITLPNSVTSIGFLAFWNCKSLTTITLPNSITSIDDNAFEDSAIKEIVIAPDMNRSIIPKVYDNLVRTEVPQSKFDTYDNDSSIVAEDVPSKEKANENVFVSRPTITPVAKQSDVDVSIPRVVGAANNTFALVIANENYRREGNVAFAQNDGKIFAEYLKSTLGLPERNVQLFVDASLNDIKFGLNKLGKICDAFDGDATVVVYYAGHGIPDERTKDAYLLPIDGYGSDVSTGYSIKELYETLGNLPSRQTLLLMDACFSGAQRDGSMMASNARGVRIKPKDNQVGGNLIVLSATQGDETAYPFEEQQHGMFTYFLLKKLKEGKRDVTIGDLADYVITNVKRTSILNNDKLQTPTVSVAPSLSSSWKTLRLSE